ncbi:multidrug effflux MFS transporter [Parasulfitobacter algicola]|uniref:Bcr/CflA family efflux transporter n=1 Tax=Parasulfitobacter algicola TaxID=2614809 RepID=A0ABX2IYY0_9RHOB|nr:multidrug effflux MFS transporter [Sulfitobacter algicola]NSX56530.1 multidrug effflux MFS transporter [Sulfitobacter algicola]
MSASRKARFFDRTTPPHISTLILLAGLSALSMSVFLPALPNMTAHYQTEPWVMQLSVALYLAVNAVMQVFIGPMSDFFGRRPIILGGIAIFIVASIGCALAPTPELFLVARMVQATIALGLVLSRAIVRDLYPQAEAASMIGYVTMGMALVPMIGPAIGGFLNDQFGWQSNFWMLVILGIATFGLVFKDLGETKTGGQASLSDQFAQYPELLKARRFWGYCLAAAFASGAFFAFLGGAPGVGAEVYGMGSTTLGFYMGAPALGYLMGNFISGKFSVRIGVNRMVLWGTAVSSFGLGLCLILSYTPLNNALTFFGFMAFVGIGNGMTLPNATAGMLSVRPHLAGTASGLGGAIMIGGGAALSAFASKAQSFGAGAAPLVWIMLITSLFSMIAIVYTIRRDRYLGTC